MKVFYGYRNLGEKLKDPIIAIGIFDGIHIGHRRVLKKILNPRAPGRDRVVLTFDPHPQTVLRSGKSFSRIMSMEHRLFIFEQMGVDAVVIIRFTPFLAGMSPEEFVKRVLRGTGTREVYVGENFHFGHRKSGSIEDFKELGKSCGIDIRTVKPVKKNRRTVSSTWLRRLISSGSIEKAERLLRRPASIFGTVVKGQRRGSTLGFPTANIDPHHEVIPPPGVYAVKARIEKKLYSGVLNIGFKPTFYGNRLKKRKESHIEVHLMGFREDLYGRNIEVFFVRHLRREKRFRDEIALKRQIQKDAEKAGKFLSSHGIDRKIHAYQYL